MSDLELPFRLPVSCVRIAGTRTFAHDSVLGRDDESPLAAVTLDVVGERDPSTLRLAEGLLVDTGVAFEWTDDGRLVTSSVELTGRAGAVAVGAVGAGVSVAGVLLGSPAMALSCAGAATGTAHRLACGSPAGAPAGAAPPAGAPTPPAADAQAADVRAVADAQAVTVAYRAAHPDEGAALDVCAALVPELVSSLAGALHRVSCAADEKARSEALGAVHALEGALSSARAEVARLDEHFRSWRTTTIATRLESYEFLLSLDTLTAARALPALSDGRLRSSGSGDEANLAALAAVQEAFDALGVLVVVDDDQGAAPPPPGAPPEAARSTAALATPARPAVDENEIVVRLPRRVRLTTYGLTAAGLVRRSSTTALVMDGRCRHTTVRISKTLFGKRAVKLGFSAGSALESLRVAAAAEAAGAADAAAALPNAVGLALERSRRVVGRVAALRTAGLDQQVSILARELQLKRQEIAQSGLLATAGSYAELASLKREIDLLEQRKALLALEADLGVEAPSAAAPATAADEP